MLKSKVAVVTGSTSGIGLGIARALAAAGADVMINGFGDAAAVDELRRDIAEAHGVRVAFSAADLTKPAESTELIEYATRELGRVDVLVNNAGIQHVAPVHKFPLERWDAVIAINLTAVFLSVRKVQGRRCTRSGAVSLVRLYRLLRQLAAHPQVCDRSRSSTSSVRRTWRQQ
jgi:3-hydroxybutyrate dehydrogenase